MDWKRILPGLVISAITLIAVFWLIDLNLFIQALRLADYRLVILGYLLSLGWIMVRGKVWQTLLQEKATYSQVFFSVNEGYLLNNLLPFRLGEVGRAFLLSRKANLEFWQVFSTVFIERAMDMALAAGLLLTTLPLVIAGAHNTEPAWARPAALVAGGLVLAMLGALYLVARNREWALNMFNRVASRWSLLKRLGERFLPPFLSGLAILTDFKRFLRSVAWILLNWGVAVLQYYTLMLAFFPQAKLLWAAFALGVVALGIAAPSSPGSLGVMEASMVGALAVFGLDASTSLALALTAHLSNYLISGIIGSYALARDGESLTGLYQSVKSINSQKPQ